MTRDDTQLSLFGGSAATGEVRAPKSPNEPVRVDRGAPKAPRIAVSFFREGTWPQDAPSHAAARALASAVAERLDDIDELDQVVVHSNKRVSVALRPKAGRYQLRLHWALLHTLDKTEAAVRHALAEGAFPQWTAAWLRAQAGTVAPPPVRPVRVRPVGVQIDLRDVLTQVTPLLPEFDLGEVYITWGRYRRQRRQRHVRLGSWVERDRLIRVHPILNDARVPEWVVAHIVFHELCHVAAPPLDPATARARREHRIHHRRFRALERRFPRLREAEAWIDANLSRLLPGT